MTFKIALRAKNKHDAIDQMQACGFKPSKIILLNGEYVFEVIL